MSFKQAWRHYPFTTFFHNCKETPENIKELFEKAKVQPTFKTLYKIEDPAKPRGVVVDVLLEIGDTKIPVDFHVMNIKGGCDTLLILGRPFLATAGAIMDLPNKQISLANVDKTVFYPTIPFISPTKLSYFITARGRPRELPHHTQGQDETSTKRICLRPCPSLLFN
ncbi:unnamed protein product [Microthlaspi erraticum]|uniref:Aspartic peptidase DDI1-type domain-containing protein n=1 Tax=Microthlaspi erraticum TaxID=1685480 RepID=A0A6D2JNT4_9BRAS|nr:unnamed protein product [Microthlaspi erraticum]